MFHNLLKRLSVGVLALSLLVPSVGLTGCQALKKHNPGVSSAQLVEVNIAVELRDANDKYLDFFTKVGDDQRAGRLSAAEVKSLNAKGLVVKKSLEKANSFYKQYRANESNGEIKALLMTSLSEAVKALAELSVQRTDAQGVK